MYKVNVQNLYDDITYLQIWKYMMDSIVVLFCSQCVEGVWCDKNILYSMKMNDGINSSFTVKVKEFLCILMYESCMVRYKHTSEYENVDSQ